MNKKFKWILVLLWLVVIFQFSSQSGSVSDGKSKFIVELFNNIGLNFSTIFGNMANFVVRKISHFIEYFILYILVFNALYKKSRVKETLLISMIVVFLYSCSDELHQLFIPGRSSRITDVLIDTSGGFLASIACFFIIKRSRGRL